MRVIISPAKRMRVDLDGFPVGGLPRFLDRTERLKAAMQAMEPQALQKLWRCNDTIAQVNVERLREMDLRRRLTPAVLSYEGIQYRYMAPGVMEGGHLAYLREHLRILSGFYGLLGPFDGVTPYRLEMQAPLSVDGCGDLYGFWGGALAEQLAAETDCVLNLASREYSRAVESWLPEHVRWYTCVFGELRAGRVVEKGTLCKMARGQMVRWLAENGVAGPEEVRAFGELGYRFSPAHSGARTFVFLWDAGGDEAPPPGGPKRFGTRDE